MYRMLRRVYAVWGSRTGHGAAMGGARRPDRRERTEGRGLKRGEMRGSVAVSPMPFHANVV